MNVTVAGWDAEWDGEGEGASVGEVSQIFSQINPYSK